MDLTMSNLQNILKEEYNKKNNEFSLSSLLEMVEEVIHATDTLSIEEALAGARERERVLRLPNVMPTEISVGQKPASEDRQQFEIWMSNIGMSGDASASAVSQKLTALTDFFANPADNLKAATVPETLSYLCLFGWSCNNQTIQLIRNN